MDTEADTERTLLISGHSTEVTINKNPSDTERVPDTVHQNAAKGPQLIAALIACLAPLTFGTVIGYSSPTIPDLQALGILEEETESWFASVITLGAMAGGLIGGFFTERLGRKGTILACGVPYTIGWLMIILVGRVRSYQLLIAGRAVCGVVLGIINMAAPSYIAEIATPNMRGFLGNLFQTAITVGVLLSFLIGIPLKWQWLALACSVLAAIMSVCVLYIPETPIFLAANRTEAEALSALRWLRGANYDHQEEYDAIVRNRNAGPSRSVPFRELLTDQSLYKPVLIVLGLIAFQQSSGINDFVFYAKSIFQSAGFNGDPAIPEVIIGAVMAGVTLLSVFIMGLTGRRVLLLISSTFMSVGCVTLGLFYYLKDVKKMHNLGWLPLPSLILYIIAFSIGWGPVNWTLMGELTPTRVKGFSGGLAVFINRTCAFLVTKNFLAMQDTFTKQGTFWIFAGINMLGGLYVILFVPETKGKSLAEIQQSFKINATPTETL